MLSLNTHSIQRTLLPYPVAGFLSSNMYIGTLLLPSLIVHSVGNMRVTTCQTQTSAPQCQCDAQSLSRQSGVNARTLSRAIFDGARFRSMSPTRTGVFCLASPMHHPPHLYWLSYNSGLFRRQYYGLLCGQDWTPPLVHDHGPLAPSTSQARLFAAIAGSTEVHRVRRLTLLHACNAGHTADLYRVMLNEV
jgi:hypothetical protein